MDHEEPDAEQDNAGSKPGRRRFLTPACMTFVTAAMTVRLFWLTRHYGVNLIFGDQWVYYTPFFTRSDALEIFRWNHGPHRMGMGLLLERAVAAATRWDNVALSFFIAALFVASALVFLATTRRLFGRLIVADALIPVAVLSFRAHEHIVTTPFVSHSALPLLLLATVALTFTFEREAVRWAIVAGLLPLLAFTGFGICIGPPLALVLISDARARGLRRGHLAVAATLVLSYLLFLVGYTFSPGRAFASSDPGVLDYGRFIAYLFSSLTGAIEPGGFALAVGVTFVGCAIAALVWQGANSWRSKEWDPKAQTALLLISFSLTFATLTAVGRTLKGSEGFVSRYVTLLLPAVIGLYWTLRRLPAPRVRRALLAASLVVIAVGSLQIPDRRTLDRFYAVKVTWADTYLCTGDIQQADAAAGRELLTVLPEARAAWSARLPKELSYLRENRLSLFNGRPVSARSGSSPSCS